MTSEHYKRVHDRTQAVVAAVHETDKQFEKWGEQNHPIVMNREGCTPERMAQQYEIPTANRARQMCNLADSKGELTWTHILLEEFCEMVEAFTLHGDEGVEELIQTNAVGLSAHESLIRKRRRANGG